MGQDTASRNLDTNKLHDPKKYNIFLGSTVVQRSGGGQKNNGGKRKFFEIPEHHEMDFQPFWGVVVSS